jgi:hypothetical protein
MLFTEIVKADKMGEWSEESMEIKEKEERGRARGRCQADSEAETDIKFRNP